MLEYIQNLWPRIKNFFKNLKINLKKDLKRPLFLANSNAVGIFCALIPFIGQAYICFLLWLLMRKYKATQFSLTISVAWTILTNPLTMSFVLFGYYMAGCFALSKKTISFSDFIDNAKDIIEKSTDWIGVIKNGIQFTLDDIGSPMLVGAIICIIIITISVYVLTYIIASYIVKYRNKEALLKK